MNRQTLIRWIIALALIGLLDALYLAYSALTHNPLACSITGLDGCNIVAGSSYSRFLGIPLAVFGVFFYGAILLSAVFTHVFSNRTLYHFLLAAASVGALSSLYFMYLQFFVIKALCVYCAFSFVVSILIFAACLHLFHRHLPERSFLDVVE